LRKLLLGLAIDADVVLDLHCDSEAVMHLYTAPELWPDAAPLAAQLGAQAVLLAADSGGEPFDESCSTPWWRLRAKLGIALPAACFATTIELRGTADVDDALAAGDADNLFRYLQRRGAVAGNPGPLPPPRCEPSPLEGVERLRAPIPGVVAFRCPIGTRVRPGQIVADIVDPTAADAAAGRVPVTATTAGILWARRLTRIAGANDIIASVAGAVPVEGTRRQLLTN
jgi:hypothetical protein